MKVIFKKIVIYFVFFCLAVSLFSGGELDQAKVNLRKSYNYFINNNYDLSKKYLDYSFEYSQNFPEYYYVNNLLMPKLKENFSIKKDNSIKIMKNLDNSFFIEPYELIKQAAEVFVKVKDFEAGLKSYEKLISIKNKIKEEDFNSYIEFLFITKEKKFLAMIPYVIGIAKKYYDSLDFDYYYALYKIRHDKINAEDFNRIINLLKANYYPEMKILYLKTLYLNSSESIGKIYDEYIDLKNNNKIDNKFSKRILINLILKSIHLQYKQKYYLLKDWLNIGNDDYRTIEILRNKDIMNIIKKDENFNNLFLKYNGIRTIDFDEDGDWERFFEYKNGIIIKMIIDDNQDGIYEYMINYLDNGNIKEYIVFLKNNANYEKYIFNENDQSLDSICYFDNNKLNKKENFTKSTIFFKSDEIKNINNINLTSFISSIEYRKDGYTFIKKEKNNTVYEKIDFNNNNIFEVEYFYKNNIIDEAYKDNNEDGNYEQYEKYDKGKLKYIMFKTDENLKNYDYKEEIVKNGSIKFWDNDHDGIFEIKIEDYYNGILLNMIDANYDGKYDLVYQTEGNKSEKIYRITEKGNILLKEFKYKENKSQRKWRIITINDTKNIIEPDDIIVHDKKNLTGVYFYNNKKYYFEKGLIKNEAFNYRFFYIDNNIYLLDMQSY